MTHRQNKGKRGEREVVTMLNDEVNKVRKAYGLPPVIGQALEFKRNPMQSAEGGYDIENNMSLAIEVKFQENLQINTWWRQCVKSATTSNRIPVLIFRQSRKEWRVITACNLDLFSQEYHGFTFRNVTRCEVPLSVFLKAISTIVAKRLYDSGYRSFN